MQPLRHDLSWFQTNSYDVLTFLGFIALALLSVVALVLSYLARKGLQLLPKSGLMSHAKSA